MSVIGTVYTGLKVLGGVGAALGGARMARQIVARASPELGGALDDAGSTLAGIGEDLLDFATFGLSAKAREGDRTREVEAQQAARAQEKQQADAAAAAARAAAQSATKREREVRNELAKRERDLKLARDRAAKLEKESKQARDASTKRERATRAANARKLAELSKELEKKSQAETDATRKAELEKVASEAAKAAASAPADASGLGLLAPLLMAMMQGAAPADAADAAEDEIASAPDAAIAAALAGGDVNALAELGLASDESDELGGLDVLEGPGESCAPCELGASDVLDVDELGASLAALESADVEPLFARRKKSSCTLGGGCT